VPRGPKRAAGRRWGPAPATARRSGRAAAPRAHRGRAAARRQRAAARPDAAATPSTAWSHTTGLPGWRRPTASSRSRRRSRPQCPGQAASRSARSISSTPNRPDAAEHLVAAGQRRARAGRRRNARGPCRFRRRARRRRRRPAATIIAAGLGSRRSANPRTASRRFRAGLLRAPGDRTLRGAGARIHLPAGDRKRATRQHRRPASTAAAGRTGPAPPPRHRPSPVPCRWTASQGTSPLNRIAREVAAGDGQPLRSPGRPVRPGAVAAAGQDPQPRAGKTLSR